jgi:hypothetical protein
LLNKQNETAMKNSIETFILNNYRVLFHILGNAVYFGIIYLIILKDLTGSEFTFFLSLYIASSYFVQEYAIKSSGLDELIKEEKEARSI